MPPNVSFQIDDATKEWELPQNSFDFIHMRCLGGSIKDWPELLRQAYMHLKPGGRIELSEGRPQICCDDKTYPDDSSTRRWEVNPQVPYYIISFTSSLKTFDSLHHNNSSSSIALRTSPVSNSTSSPNSKASRAPPVSKTSNPTKNPLHSAPGRKTNVSSRLELTSPVNSSRRLSRVTRSRCSPE